MARVEQRKGGHRVGAAWRQVALLACVVLYASGCGGGTVSDARLAKMRALFDEGMIERDPLCIEAGPFPVRSGAVKGSCDRCQDLAQAGLLSRKIVDDAAGGYVRYALTRAGAAVYREEPDEEYLDIVRARFAQQGDPDRQVDAAALARPRMCFGQTRFHRVTDALSPLTMAGSTYVSVRLVAKATDTSKRLFDPRIAALGLPIPPAPEAGQPGLYPARVMTFQEFPDGSLEVSDVRYGVWVNEP